jgi:hypothetical protein
METPLTATSSAEVQPNWMMGTNGALLFVSGLILLTLLFGYITEESFRGTLIRGGG